MKLFKQLSILAILILVNTSAHADRKGGGGYDFEDRKGGPVINVAILKEAVQSALNKDGGCNVKLLVRAIGAAMFETPDVPEKMEGSQELSKSELACWNLAINHITRYNKSLESIFKVSADKE